MFRSSRFGKVVHLLVKWGNRLDDVIPLTQKDFQLDQTSTDLSLLLLTPL
uniref:Uncharacterized protein n=1 Tax=Strigamia maritima TaxID=126957 RepID=T1JLB2_STRMM